MALPSRVLQAAVQEVGSDWVMPVASSFKIPVGMLEESIYDGGQQPLQAREASRC